MTCGVCVDTSTTLKQLCPVTCGVYPTPAPTKSDYADYDTNANTTAGSVEITITSCGNVATMCDRTTGGNTLEQLCPVTCGACPTPAPTTSDCADNDANANTTAASVGMTITSCGDVATVCDHATYGNTLKQSCLVTCGACPTPALTTSDCADNDAMPFLQPHQWE